MQTKKASSKLLFCSLLITAGMGTSRAQTVTNADSSATLNLGASWVGGVPAGPANVAVWDSTVQVNTSKTLGASQAWAGIQVVNPGGLITIAADGNTLTSGASGIDLSLATVGLTIGSPVTLNANQAWLVTGGEALTVSGIVSGPERLTLNNGGNNTGTIILSGANTYSGGTVINSGVAQPNTINAFGTGAVTNNGGTLLLSVFPNAGIMTNAFNVSGTSMIDMFNRSVSDVLDGPWSGNGTILVTNITASGSTLTFGGASGGNMANFTGSIIVVSNASGTASAGAIRFNNGGSQVNNGNSQMSINLGANSTVILENRDAGTTSVGELTGGSGTAVTGQTSGSGTETWSIGGKNTTATFAGIFKTQGSSGLTALTKVGTGTFILTGPNSYTGATTITGGILQIGDGVTAGAGQLGTANVNDNATLVFARPDAISVANAINGNGNLVQAGASSLALGAANAYAGTTIITNGGTILVAAAGAIPATTALTLGGSGTSGTLDLAGNNVQVSALNTGSAAPGSAVGSSGGSNPTILTVNATNGTSAFSGVIQDTLPGGSGVVALVVQNGKMTLSGVNTYSGSTTISNGVLALGGGGSIGSSTAIILTGNGGSVLDASAVGGITISSGKVLAANGAVNGNVTASGCLITPGTNGLAGTLTCSNNLSLSGNVTVAFDLSSVPTSGNDQIIVDGALNLSGLNTIEINPLTDLGVGTYRLIVCSSIVGSVGNLQLAGSPGTGLNAVLNVTGTEVDLVVTASAAPFVWAGDGSLNQWDYTSANWRSNGAAAVFSDGDFVVFDDTGSHTPAVDITAPVAPATVTVNSSINYTLGSLAGSSGKITGFGSLSKTNTGSLTLLTANDYTGGTYINQGTVQVGNGSLAGTTLGNGNVTDNGSVVFNQPDTYDFTNVISGSGMLSQAGSGTLMLSGNNTYSGTTFISAGTLQVGDGNASGSLGTNTITDNSALAYNRTGSLTQSGKITGTGTLTLLSGTVAVTASNDFSGLTTIDSGATLQLGKGGTLGSVLLSNVTDNGTLAFDHSVDETNGIAIVGSGGISQMGTNVLTLAGANTYNGNTAIATGTIKVGSSGTVPTGPGDGNIVLNGTASSAGTFEMNGFDVTVNGLAGSSNSVLGRVVNNFGSTTNILTIGNGDATTTFYGSIEDNNNGGNGKIALVKVGAGTITFGNTNGFTGGTIISNGTVAMQNALANGSGGLSAFGPTNNPIIFAGGGLTLFNSGNDNETVFTFYNPLIVAAGQTGTITLFERGDLYSTLTGSGTLNTVDPGSRGTLAGNWSAFTGTINITSGQFRINNSFGYSNAIININDGADLDTGGDGNPGPSGQTIDIGELDGTSGAFIGNGGKPSPNQTWRVGWKNTTSTFAGTIVNGTTSGSTGDSLYKVGTGVLVLTGQNTYQGTTTISNGVLALATGAGGDGSIDNSATINILPNGILDVSGRSDDTLQLGSSATQTVEGRGLINGQLNVNPSGVVAPGGGPGGNTGILTVTNSITLGGVAWMKLNRTNSLNSDRLVSSLSTITYGGTLVVTNVGAQLQPGDTFTLFSGSGLSAGSFSTVVLPSYYTWDTSKLAVNGSITVIGASRPVITSVDFSTLQSGTITLNAADGTPNGPVAVLTTTNLALPISSWTTNTTSSFDGSGNLNLPITVNPTLPQSYFLLQAY